MKTRRTLAALGTALLLAGTLAACGDAPTASDPSATRPLYSLPAPAVTVTNSGGTPLVSWGALVGATSYTVTLEHFTKVTSRTDPWTQTLTYAVGTTTGTSILDSARTWTGVSHCYSTFPEGSTRTDTWRYRVKATFASGTTTSTVAAPVGEC